jgi:hypothetical protein
VALRRCLFLCWQAVPTPTRTQLAISKSKPGRRPQASAKLVFLCCQSGASQLTRYAFQLRESHVCILVNELQASEAYRVQSFIRNRKASERVPFRQAVWSVQVAFNVAGDFFASSLHAGPSFRCHKTKRQPASWCRFRQRLRTRGLPTMIPRYAALSERRSPQ